MKKIAFFLLAIYGALFLILTAPVILAAFYPEIQIEQVRDAFTAWPYWVLCILLLVSEAGLLFLPLQLTTDRPLRRRHLFVPVIAAGFLIGLLGLGILTSLNEFILKNGVFEYPATGWSAIACCALIWIVWAGVFALLTRNADPKGVVLSQCHRLLQGSVITLLIAVPTHIIARHRNYCCAGFSTFIGITFGIAVMLISFGPGIFFLYAERWARVRPKKSVEQLAPGQSYFVHRTSQEKSLVHRP